MVVILHTRIIPYTAIRTDTSTIVLPPLTGILPTRLTVLATIPTTMATIIMPTPPPAILSKTQYLMRYLELTIQRPRIAIIVAQPKRTREVTTEEITIPWYITPTIPTTQKVQFTTIIQELTTTTTISNTGLDLLER